MHRVKSKFLRLKSHFAFRHSSLNSYSFIYSFNPKLNDTDRHSSQENSMYVNKNKMSIVFLPNFWRIELSLLLDFKL